MWELGYHMQHYYGELKKPTPSQKQHTKSPSLMVPNTNEEWT